MENLSDVSPSKTNGDTSKNHIFNNEKSIQLEDKVGKSREEDNEIFLNESIVLDSKCKNSMNEVNNIPSNDISNEVITEKGIFNDKKKDKFIDLENKQDSGIFEDVVRQECGVLNEDSNSLTEQKCKNSLKEVNNIPSNDINNEVTTDKDIFNDKEKDIFNDLENKQDSGVFEDVLRQECEVLNEDGSSLKEQSESLDKDDFFPDINKDDIKDIQEEELVFDKGILEENEHGNESSVNHEARSQADSAVLEHLSPEKDADESDSEQEDQEREDYRSTRKELSLPYFQLPKPDLDEFLTEMEKNLGVPVKSNDNELSEQSSVPSKPKQKDIITLKPPPNVKGNFDPKKVFITFDLSSESCKVDPIRNINISESKPKVSSGLLNSEYEKVLSSLEADEEKPGAKRIALKEFLKKQIDQKKYEAFTQFKILNNMDEEIELLSEKEEYPESDDEDSTEEFEEATISFEKKDKKSEDENEVPEEFQPNGENSDEESDDDFIGVRKTKKKFLVLDDDSCDTNNFMKEEKRDCNLLNMDDSSSLDLPELHEIVKSKLDENSDKLNVNDAEIDNKDLKLSKNGDSAFGAGIFQTSENNSMFSQISSSMPSFQPGGGFLNQDHRQENSSDSIISSTASQQNIDNTNEENENLYLCLQPEQNLLRGVKTPVLENDSVLENASLTPSEDSNNFGIKLDDLPVSQSVNDSDIFLTEELADVCSGAFNKGPSYDKTPETNLKFGEKVTDFFDDEAELSGEDDGIDEKDDSEGEGDNLDIYASDEENLPEAEILREEIADLHMKRLMDEDDERIKAIQEQFLDDGELDGAGRSRRFAWLNNDVDIAPAGDNSDSDSDAEAVDDSLALNQEKAKWRQENKEDENADLTEELNSSGYRRKSFLKVDIIGKPKFCHEEDSSRRLSCKRSRGSYLNLDDSSASQVLKKLKASEDNLGGSRTTKHFVFRNDVSDVPALTRKVPAKSIAVESPNGTVSSKRKSIFNKI